MANKVSKFLINRLIFSKNENQLTSIDWDLLLRQARVAGVIARLTFFWKKFGLFEPPNFVAIHLISAEKYWLSQKQIVNWELFNLIKVFDHLQLPLILLKGSAYSAADLITGFGRVFNDIDILVSKRHIDEVQEGLKFGGWFPEPLDSYDQRYYNSWMHELPPMQHIQRGTSLDVHHNILPETCILCPDADLLIQSAVKIPNTNYWTLCPQDMILHSACHLFWGGEFENGLRDLSDIDLLIREFSNNDPTFWEKLLARASLLGLGKPLFYALRYSNKMLATPLPDEVVTNTANYGGVPVKNKIMDWLFLRALKPAHSTCNDRWTGLARWLLFVRSHWLKMPFDLLVMHLSRKAYKRLIGKDQH